MLTVPLGDLHISFNLNSSTRASSGVMVAHLMPTLYLMIASAASTVTLSLVFAEKSLTWDRSIKLVLRAYLVTVLQSQVVVLDVKVEVGKDELDTR
jgi:hypothetical protein